MRTKEIIQDEIIRLLFAKVSKGEALDVTELLEFHKLTKELDSLKSAKDNADRSTELTRILTLARQEMNASEFKNWCNFAVSEITGLFEKDEVKSAEETSVDKIINNLTYIAMTIQSDVHDNELSKHLVELLNGEIKILESYKQSESKDMYPKAFVEWIGQQELYYDGKKWIEVDDTNLVHKKSTDELFNHWSTVINSKI